ncbi:MAG: acetyl/propionyl/methylcrotonyl-CoA carboxylase subunit alpha [Alphaproteobacteria bacterium]
MSAPFDKILIANRGEIACRVMRTAKRLGMRTVAVYSSADKGALHASLADEAFELGPPAPAESYLRTAAVLEAARRSGAEAVHPGYGFLAENADFADACVGAGLVFVGSPAEVIRRLALKNEARALMGRAGLPVVPGYEGEDQDDKALKAAAERLGFPLVIKATAGGGGKGMRRVESPSAFAAALASARREALGAFGDDRVVLEAWLEAPRHVEVQLFGDCHGNVVHLFERDCSVQRRHQKVVEEAPAPGLEPGLRRRLFEAAVRAARAAGFVGAGTVEFLVDDGAFYFLEMNTRLQVEHPVTEMVTGEDLVEWQFRVAAGEQLPRRQNDIEVSGHAVEARLYAEDPARDFLPATGRLFRWRTQARAPDLRVETGVGEGDQVSLHYESMLAKLIVWGETRPAAIQRLAEALAGVEVAGVATNLEFLAAVIRHPAFVEGRADTGLVERERGQLVRPREPAPERALNLAALHLVLTRSAEAAERAKASRDPHSPWNLATGWRLNQDGRETLRFEDGEATREVCVSYRTQGYVFEVSGAVVEARGRLRPDGDLEADLDGVEVVAAVVKESDWLNVFAEGGTWRLRCVDPLAVAVAAHAQGGRLTAPMPGKVVRVMVEPGAEVERGAALLALEAMKMEHTIAAPIAGRVARIHYRVGELVEEGAELLALEPEAGA